MPFYNYERPHQGYRHLGKRLIDTINNFAKVASLPDTILWNSHWAGVYATTKPDNWPI